jgi:hypothetical protein
MATTTVEVLAAPGQTTVTLTSRGGTTGTAAASYTLTRIGTYLCTISITEALVGYWVAEDGVGVETPINALVDEEITIRLGDVPTAAENRAEMDANSTQLAAIKQSTQISNVGI